MQGALLEKLFHKEKYITSHSSWHPNPSAVGSLSLSCMGPAMEMWAKPLSSDLFLSQVCMGNVNIIDSIPS